MRKKPGFLFKQRIMMLLEDKELDPVILEFKLPDMNEVEVMRQVGLSYPQTQVVILTEERSFESAMAAMRSGAVDYLLKPYEREELLSSVGRAQAASSRSNTRPATMNQTRVFIAHSPLSRISNPRS